MIAVDTNVLVYAYRPDVPHHDAARHSLDELWSADRDFSRFPELRVRNPLVRAR